MIQRKLKVLCRCFCYLGLSLAVSNSFSTDVMAGKDDCKDSKQTRIFDPFWNEFEEPLGVEDRAVLAAGECGEISDAFEEKTFSDVWNKKYIKP